MCRQRPFPSLIAKGTGATRGVHDVQKENRSEHAIDWCTRDPASDEPLGFVQNTISIACEERMIEPGQFDELRVGDVSDEVSRVVDWDDGIFRPTQEHSGGLK